MRLTKERKLELELKSKHAYGSKHKWRKNLENGVLITDTVATELYRNLAKKHNIMSQNTKYNMETKQVTDMNPKKPIWAYKKVYLTLEQLESAMDLIIKAKEEQLKKLIQQLKETQNEQLSTGPQELPDLDANTDGSTTDRHDDTNRS